MSDEPLDLVAEASDKPTREISPINALREELEAVRGRLRALIRQVGEPAMCQGCEANIYFVRHLNGRNAPYDADGVNHFATCPKAENFRRKRGPNHARP